MRRLHDENGRMDGVVKGLAAATLIVGLAAQAWLHFVGPTSAPAGDRRVPLAAMTEATVRVPCSEFFAAGGEFEIRVFDETGGAPGTAHPITLYSAPTDCVLNGRYNGLALVLKSCNADSVYFYARGSGVAQQGEGTCTAERAAGTMRSTGPDDQTRSLRFRISRI